MLVKIFLTGAGGIAVGLGSLILLVPAAFYAGYGLNLTGQVTLLNELRSHGLSLIGIGLFVITGAFVPRLATSAALVAALFYLSYGLSRLVGLALDGWPGQGLALSGAVELVVGSIALLIYRRRGPSALSPC
nr:DUF4345 domain-containing protein [uncultured Devosia sp.]